MPLSARAVLSSALAALLLLPAFLVATCIGEVPGAGDVSGHAGVPTQPVWRDKPFALADIPQHDGPAFMAPQPRSVVKLLILAIQFSDVKASNGHTAATIDEMADGPGNSMNTYYYQCSYGRVNVSSACYGWYNSTQNKARYGAPSANDHDATDLYKLVTEAVTAADAAVNFSQYDQNGDGWVDYLMIVHAGGDEATSGNGNDIWSHEGWDSDAPTVDGKRVGLYSMISEDDAMGVMAHEFGHQLGMPDLYDTDGASSGGQTSGAGLWDIMAAGNYLNSGDTPAMPSAWSRSLMGWANVFTLYANTDGVVLGAAELCSTVVRLNLPGHPQEYYLIENRQQTGYDAYLPGEGLLIWHIDDSKGSVNGNNLEVAPGKKRVSLEEAHGGRMDLDGYSYNLGDARDPWYSNTGGFTPTSDPNTSAASDGRFTFISVKGIGPSVMNMSFSVQFDTPVYAMELVPPSTTQKVDPGTAAEYSVSVYNYGSLNDFNISIEGAHSAWSRPAQSPVRLDYLAQVTVKVTVLVPWGTAANLTWQDTFRVVPVTDPLKAVSTLVTIKVNPKYRAMFSPPTDIALAPGEKRSVTLTVTNGGNLADTIQLALSGPGLSWIEYTGPASFPLASGSNASFTLQASVPWGTPANGRSYIYIGGRSGDGSTAAGIMVNLSATAARLIELRLLEEELHLRPGAATALTVELVNAGTSDAELTLAAASEPGWEFDPPQNQLLAPAWSSQEVTIAVTPAPDAPAGLRTGINLTYTGAGFAGSASMPAVVDQVFGASVEGCATSAEVLPGVPYVYHLMVVNSGNGPDDLAFELLEAIDGEGWDFSLDSRPLRLKAKEATEVEVTVTSPENAYAGTEQRLSLAIRHSNGNLTFIELVSTVARVQRLALAASPQARSGDPGGSVEFQLTVTNKGNWQELVLLSLPRPEGLTADFDKDSVSLEPGASDGVQLTFRLSQAALAGIRNINLTAFPESNESVNATVALKVTVNTVYGAAASFRQEALGCDAGASVVFQMTLANRGNAPDTYVLSKSAGTLGVAFDRPSVSLKPGESTSINLTVSVPSDEGGGPASLKIAVRSQGRAGEVALKEITVDVKAKPGVAPALIAIPLVVAAVVAAVVAVFGLLHFRKRRRGPNGPAGTAAKGAPAASPAKPPQPAAKSAVLASASGQPTTREGDARVNQVPSDAKAPLPPQ